MQWAQRLEKTVHPPRSRSQALFFQVELCDVEQVNSLCSLHFPTCELGQALVPPSSLVGRTGVQAWQRAGLSDVGSRQVRPPLLACLLPSFSRQRPGIVNWGRGRKGWLENPGERYPKAGWTGERGGDSVCALAPFCHLCPGHFLLPSAGSLTPLALPPSKLFNISKPGL